MPNALIHESSPYLLQHAHNPVQWLPWGAKALNKAQTEHKPILVSIGYSACHWCHVMEHESFEHEDIAALMNEHFVCIKVDREERPDVDTLYMDALHAMGGRGGWPLNVFLMPDAKPFYGVTYLPPQNWAQLLESIHYAFLNNQDELLKSAHSFVEHLSVSESDKYNLTGGQETFSVNDLDRMFDHLSQHFDHEKGGFDRAPKFPMPSVYKFLLRYYAIRPNPAVLRQIAHSLNCMALGGIYDHVGGGWARYSVDEDWFIPHFEKMLYDNAQLVSVYAEAFTLTQNPLYKQRVYETIDWLKSEMTAPSGGFYAALDADSEGIEGKFYVWAAEELKAILGNDYADFANFYTISPKGNWEHGLNHLHLTPQVPNVTDRLASDVIKRCLQKLFENRNQRIRPGLDNKILASWNGLMLKGLTDAYRAFDEPLFLELAIHNAQYLKDTLITNGQLWRTRNDKTSINGFLEDYAAVIDGFLGLYQVTFNETWLNEAIQLMAYSLAHFYDDDEQLFYFSDKNNQELVATKKEIFDNVTPASNSLMAHNLYTLGLLYGHTDYLTLADWMLSKMKKLLLADVQWATNWAALYALRATPTAEVVMVGSDIEVFRKQLEKQFLPNKILAGTTEASDLALLENRTAINGQTTIYICKNQTCQLPVTTVEAALEQMWV